MSARSASGRRGTPAAHRLTCRSTVRGRRGVCAGPVADRTAPRAAARARGPPRHEGAADAPWQPAVGEVDLRPLPGRRLEAHHRLRHGHPTQRAYGGAELRVSAGIAGGPELGEEAHGGEFRQLAEPLSEERLVGIQLGRDRRPRGVAGLDAVRGGVEKSLVDPAVHHGAVHTELAGGGADRRGPARRGGVVVRALALRACGGSRAVTALVRGAPNSGRGAVGPAQSRRRGARDKPCRVVVRQECRIFSRRLYRELLSRMGILGRPSIHYLGDHPSAPSTAARCATHR